MQALNQAPGLIMLAVGVVLGVVVTRLAGGAIGAGFDLLYRAGAGFRALGAALKRLAIGACVVFSVAALLFAVSSRTTTDSQEDPCPTDRRAPASATSSRGPTSTPGCTTPPRSSR